MFAMKWIKRDTKSEGNYPFIVLNNSLKKGLSHISKIAALTTVEENINYLYKIYHYHSILHFK